MGSTPPGKRGAPSETMATYRLRDEALGGNLPCWHLDLGLPCFQNSEE